MTQVAGPDSIIPDVDGLELSHNGIRYKVSREGERYFVSTHEGDGDADFSPDRQEIVLLTGSHTLQIFWMETGDGRTLVQFPLAYIISEKIWAPVTQTFLLPPEFREIYAPGEWNGACMDCHVTRPLSRFVGGNVFDSSALEFGISCEACHGPGREHIEENRNPVRRYAKHLRASPDTTVANAARMNGQKASLTCGQCHSVWAFNNLEDKIAWNQEGGGYEPGDEAMRLRWIVQPTSTDRMAEKRQILDSNEHYFADRFWGDGMIRVTGREMNGVEASPCYKGGEFSCMSCHEMHPEGGTHDSLTAWADDQLKGGMRGDLACLQCHDDFAGRITEHTRHPENSTGSSCYNCHMPHTTYGLLRAVRSHQVSSPTALESVAHGRPNACNLCHLDKTLGWTATHLKQWFDQPVPELSSDDREYSAALNWLLKGDAGQRALVAWSMGWTPAQEASGRDWLYPYLLMEFDDSYAAVRFIAWKSLKTLPGFHDYKFDYTADSETRTSAMNRAYETWWRTLRNPDHSFEPSAILLPDGRFELQTLQRFLSQTDNKRVFLAE